MKAEEESMKTVTILLTKYSDWFGTFICKICKKDYSHASISIDEKEEVFYSFNYKGFIVEKPKIERPKARKQESLCIRLQVPEHIYKIIEEEINEFLLNKDFYKYSCLGVVLCLLQIPHKFKGKYFCSQFIAEILLKAGAVKLKKKESLYLPVHLIDGIECLFSQKQLIYDII